MGRCIDVRQPLEVSRVFSDKTIMRMRQRHDEFVRRRSGGASTTLLVVAIVVLAAVAVGLLVVIALNSGG